MASLVSSSSATHHGASLCWSMSLCSSRRRRHDGSSSTNNYNNVVALASRRHHRSSSVSSSSGGRKKGRRCRQTSFFSSSSRQNREKSAWCFCRVGRDAGVQKVVVQAAASKSSGTTSATTHWGGGSSASVEDVKKCALITAIKTPYLKSGKIDLQKYGTRVSSYRRIVASSFFFRILIRCEQQRAIVSILVFSSGFSIFVCLFVRLFVSSSYIIRVLILWYTTPQTRWSNSK